MLRGQQHSWQHNNINQHCNHETGTLSSISLITLTFSPTVLWLPQALLLPEIQATSSQYRRRRPSNNYKAHSE
ncbi:unnamed protein product [Sordaria macrospora k-hell]|uniref:WGS project CABT00000000 data, contig 2.54 n=1 Tax=Sordaria macrospora (strain ATCC MYA-333 / DSM 997 / K(L3346) / K-hell) TaxID=771870 RepID=F7W9S7_SORMK